MKNLLICATMLVLSTVSWYSIQFVNNGVTDNLTLYYGSTEFATLNNTDKKTVSFDITNVIPIFGK